MNGFRRDNHFIPKMYLKRWSSDGRKIFGYRTLVSHPNIPEWNHYSIRGIAVQPHLYTRLSTNGETDEFERWLEKEFETPAEEAINKATSDRKLSRMEWERLIRFAASLSVRTPVQLFQSMKRWHEQMPSIMESTLEGAVEKLENAKKTGSQLTIKNSVENVTFPLRVSKKPLPNTDQAILKVETIVGRSMWLFGIKHILTKTINVLLEHRWSILHALPDFEWVTSDDPVLRLNYYKKGSYDFGGGWGYKGSEILLPLSPHHLLYTKVGEKKKRNIEMNYKLCSELQQLIAEHSHRWIFANRPIKEIETLRPRVVDPIAYNLEMESWKKWHDEQTDAEFSLINKPKNLGNQLEEKKR